MCVKLCVGCYSCGGAYHSTKSIAETPSPCILGMRVLPSAPDIKDMQSITPKTVAIARMGICGNDY